jgi:hypothetical protein
LVALTFLVEHVNAALPEIELAGVEFAEMKELPLQDEMALDAQTFADGIIVMSPAVFGAGATFEKHAGAKKTPVRGGPNKVAGWPTDTLGNPSPVTLTPQKS